jgi:hypothetical protein
LTPEVGEDEGNRGRGVERLSLDPSLLGRGGLLSERANRELTRVSREHLFQAKKFITYQNI